MSNTGMSCQIDDLGRVYFSKEIRNAMDIKPGDKMDVIPDKMNGLIILRPELQGCAVCGDKDLGGGTYKGKTVCHDCINHLTRSVQCNSPRR